MSQLDLSGGSYWLEGQFTLKIPAMDKVRLEVQETSRNSEKLKPKASRPPQHRVNRERRNGESSVTRNNLSEVLRLRPGKTTAERFRTTWIQTSLVLATVLVYLLLGTKGPHANWWTRLVEEGTG